MNTPQRDLFWELFGEQFDHVVETALALVNVHGIEAAKREMQAECDSLAQRISISQQTSGTEDVIDSLVLVSLMAGGLYLDLRLAHMKIRKLSPGKFIIVDEGSEQ